MTRYLLDTCSLVDYAKGREPTCSALMALLSGSDVIGISAVQIAEYFAGILPGERSFWRQFFDGLTFWPITVEIAITAGNYRYDYARLGRALSATDTLIAAVALAHDAIVVTDNFKDFPMPEIRLLRLGQ